MLSTLLLPLLMSGCLPTIVDDWPSDSDDTSSCSEQSWYIDVDGDGYGDADVAIEDCTPPSGYVADATDCNDNDAHIHPGAREDDCQDDTDYNCDGSFGEVDQDDDGYLACEGDCNDDDVSVNPDATEVCDDADVDEDCNGLADDDDGGVDASTLSTFYADADGDSYGNEYYSATACDQPEGYATNTDDCDDNAAGIHPDATEVCDDLDVDENCNGLADDDDSGVDSSTLSTFYADADGDSYGNELYTLTTCNEPDSYVASDEDCNDEDASINPAAIEVCDDLDVDEDCNGLADDDDGGVDASTFFDWYLDDDGDGYGDPDTSASTCSQPEGYETNADDCDDTDAEVNPNSVWYVDGDSDGYGDSDSSLVQCEQLSGYVADDTDCLDDESSVNPGASADEATVWDTNCDGTDDRDGATFTGSNEGTWTAGSANLIDEDDWETVSTFTDGTDWEVYVSSDGTSAVAASSATYVDVLVGDFTTMNALQGSGSFYDDCIISPSGAISGLTSGETYGFVMQIRNEESSEVTFYVYLTSGYEEDSPSAFETEDVPAVSEETVNGVFEATASEEQVILCSNQSADDQVHITHVSVHEIASGGDTGS